MIVTLVTNTTDIFPQHVEVVSDSNPANYVCRLIVVPDTNPKEKWVRTEIVETGKIWFKLHGQITEGIINQPVTNWTTHFDLEPPKWVQSKTNVPVPDVWPDFYNVILPAQNYREPVWITNSGQVYGITPN